MKRILGSAAIYWRENTSDVLGGVTRRMDQEPPAAIHCCGPFQGALKSEFLCPVCDDDRVTGLEGAEIVCCVEWLTGQWIVGDNRVGNRACYCFVSDPFENDENATNSQRRFYFYRTLAILLGGGGQRVDLPDCVLEKIQELYGEGVVGFNP